MQESSLDWTQKVELLLDSLCLSHKLITYAELAEASGVTPPHKIHKLTEVLERLMQADCKAGRPLRAAVVISKVRDIPAPGFFSLAKSLGLYEGTETGADAIAYHQTCLHALFNA